MNWGPGFVERGFDAGGHWGYSEIDGVPSHYRFPYQFGALGDPGCQEHSEDGRCLYHHHAKRSRWRCKQLRSNCTRNAHMSLGWRSKGS